MRRNSSQLKLGIDEEKIHLDGLLVNLGLDAGESEIPAFGHYYDRDENPQSGHTRMRLIWVPNEAARVVQTRLKDYLLSVLADKFSPFGTACRSGCAPIWNVLRHRRNRFFYLLDLHKAYPSIKIETAVKVLCELDPKLKGKEEAVAKFLGKTCFLSPEMIVASGLKGKIRKGSRLAEERNGLMTGGPAAPLLCDLIVGHLLDKKIVELLKDRVGKEFIYTRYLDDLTISFPVHRIEKNHGLRRGIRRIILEAGFTISDRKCFVRDMKKGIVSITGLDMHWVGEGHDAFVKLSAAYLKHVKNVLYRAGKENSTVTKGMISGAWGPFKSSLKLRNAKTLTRMEADIIKSYSELTGRSIEKLFSRQKKHSTFAADFGRQWSQYQSRKHRH